MGSDVVAKIAMESPSEQERRMQLSSRAAKLRKGLDVCKSALGDFHQGIILKLRLQSSDEVILMVLCL